MQHDVVVALPSSGLFHFRHLILVSLVEYPLKIQWEYVTIPSLAIVSTDKPPTNPLLHVTALEGVWNHDFTEYAQYEQFWKHNLTE
jgi:hypothetical protein